MELKTEIKQENCMLENERELLSEDLGRKINTDVETGNVCKLESKIKIKVEGSFPYKETFMCSGDDEIDLRAETKEGERRKYSKDCMTKAESLDYEADTQIQIKQEVCWIESVSANSSSLSQDGTNEHSPPAKSTSFRSSMEADSGGSVDESAILPDQDRHFKDAPEFEEGTNWKTLATKTAIHSDHIKGMHNVLQSLKQDNNLVQQKNEFINNACNVCGKKYSKSSSLKRHSLTHGGEMPYQCDICGKNFRDSWNLSRHSFIHEGQKPYKCDVCEKGFAIRSTLKRHRLIHVGEKPYECNICKKAFIDLSHLKRHNHLIHETKSVHKCAVCAKTFTYLSNLKNHNLIHEDTRPFNCSLCDKSFAHLLGLKTHNHRTHLKRKGKCT